MRVMCFATSPSREAVGAQMGGEPIPEFVLSHLEIELRVPDSGGELQSQTFLVPEA